MADDQKISVFCQWVDESVDSSRLHELCGPFQQGDICRKCERSPQLDIGGTATKLLDQLKDK